MYDDRKEVNFFKYCPLCKHEKKKDKEDPCNECLGYPVNDGTRKPVKFEQKERIRKNG